MAGFLQRRSCILWWRGWPLFDRFRALCFAYLRRCREMLILRFDHQAISFCPLVIMTCFLFFFSRVLSHFFQLLRKSSLGVRVRIPSKFATFYDQEVMRTGCSLLGALEGEKESTPESCPNIAGGPSRYLEIFAFRGGGKGGGKQLLICSDAQQRD